MVVIGAIEVGTDTHALHPQLTVDDSTISIYQTRLSETDALDLRTRQHNACREGLDEEILKRSLLILNLYRTLFPE